jgi:predicted phosphodiesterase
VSGREQIALVSDVHGNLTALEAVLADVDERGIERVFNLGDYVGKGPRGREVVARCRERCEVNLLGNWDDVVGDRTKVDGADLLWWRDQLDDDQVDWLAGLPFCHDLLVSGRRVRLLHASAETVHRRVRYVKTEEEFLGMFATTPATLAAVGEAPEPDVVGYADTHDPFYETQLRGRTLFNTGSAGNAMGDPTASYVVLDGVVGGTEPAPFALTFVRVPYDVEAELAVAREMGLPNYAGYEAELRLGLYRGALADYEAGVFDLDTYYHATAPA